MDDHSHDDIDKKEKSYDYWYDFYYVGGRLMAVYLRVLELVREKDHTTTGISVEEIKKDPLFKNMSKEIKKQLIRDALGVLVCNRDIRAVNNTHYKIHRKTKDAQDKELLEAFRESEARARRAFLLNDVEKIEKMIFSDLENTRNITNH